MSDHAWSQENLDAYLAGGLPLDERERLERHVAGCDACVSALAAAQKLDRVLTGLFVPVRPDAALEDRAIQHLRKSKPRRLSRWAMVARVVGGAAAVLLLGGLGVVMQALAADGDLPFPGLERKAGGERSWSLNNLKPVGAVAQLFDRATRRMGDTQTSGLIEIMDDKKESFSVYDIDLSAKEYDTNINYQADRLGRVSVPSTIKANESLGIMDGDKSTPAIDLRARNYSSMEGEIVGGKAKRKLNVYGITDGEEKALGYYPPALSLILKAPSRIHGPEGGGGGGGGGYPPGGLPLQGSFYGRSGATRELARSGDIEDKKAGETTDYYKLHLFADSGQVTKERLSESTATTGTPLVANLSQKPSGGPAGPNGHALSGPTPAFGMPAIQSGDPSKKATAGYFKPSDLASQGPMARKPALAIQFDDKAEESKAVVKLQNKREDIVKELEILNTDRTRQLAIVQQPKPPEPAADTSRKIIRTGEMEFEIDSFDSSVAKIADLINAVKGGFVATVNSDKLPNGKVRGSVVVRMPPQFLDKFLLDLRRDLGKVGELKTQRIGSQDVTKQYTDIESRLRAAHTMEDRFIAIIKNGKGEVKDLIAAEKELGVWRTKIEEMEGEIRYYNNQVGLSTLTISLTEKEIQAASALVVTERVGMRIEVEDVEKSHIDALKAVAEEKGRITKSELKQHPAGQLEAILQVEVAPEKAKKLRDVFKKLGNVTFSDVQRLQQAVGGTGGILDTKLRQSDVQIHVVLYDAANIQPRESVNLLIATDDVQASYRLLQTAVIKAKGQIRTGQLREPDKININAEFNFDAPMPERQGIDKILGKLGVILSSTDNQVPINETATDRKYGYRLVLRNLATIPARDSTIQSIAVNDVPTIYRELQDAVLAVKGIIHLRQLTEQDKINIRANLNFDVPKAERPAFDKVLAKLGMVLSTASAQAQANEITTDRKFGYQLTLLNLASIKPRETITQQIAAKDVPTSFRELQDAVVQAKGVIHLGQVNEQDRLNISADFNFDIPKEERANIEKVLTKLGAVLTSSSSQVPLNEIASDKKIGYRVKLLNLANIRPREIFALQLASNDVPASFNELRDAVLQAKGVVHLDQLVEDNKINVIAKLDFDVAMSDKPAIDRLIAKVGAVLRRSNSQANVNELASDRKVGYRLILNNVAAIPPREVITIRIDVDDVDKRAAELSALVRASKGQASKPKTTTTPQGEVTAVVKFDVPLAAADVLVPQIKAAGMKPVVDQTPNPQVPDNELATAQIIVTLVGGRPTIPSDEGLWAPIQNSLYISFKVLTWSIMFVILGLCVVLPWVVVVWLCVKVFRRMRGRPEAEGV